MANERARSGRKLPTDEEKPEKPGTAQLNVRVPKELARRVNAVAGAKGQSLAQFVADTLDERTKEHKSDVARMAEREKSPKRWE